VARGGGWYSNAFYARCVYRDDGNPNYRNYSIGFRLVRP
jgi:formylglycine-generating enzyme required for sulfatase activity